MFKKPNIDEFESLERFENTRMNKSIDSKKKKNNEIDPEIDKESFLFTK
jgi:hypothetical protein